MRDMERFQHELYATFPAFQRKVEQAQRLVEDALQQMSRPYIATSSGKDSCVTSHLVWSVNPDVPGVYFDADCAFPETRDYFERLSRHRTIITWKTEPLLDTFARCGGPTAPGIGNATMESTVYAPLRSLFAEYHFDGVFLGLRAQESEGRSKSAQFHGSLYRYKRDGVLRCLPVATWTHQDIWAYIVSRNLDYNRVYDTMQDMPIADRRVSYWAGETKRRWGRWTFLKKHYPDLWNRFAERFPEVREYV